VLLDHSNDLVKIFDLDPDENNVLHSVLLPVKPFLTPDPGRSYAGISKEKLVIVTNMTITVFDVSSRLGSGSDGQRRYRDVSRLWVLDSKEVLQISKNCTIHDCGTIDLVYINKVGRLKRVHIDVKQIGTVKGPTLPSDVKPRLTVLPCPTSTRFQVVHFTAYESTREASDHPGGFKHRLATVDKYNALRLYSDCASSTTLSCATYEGIFLLPYITQQVKDIVSTPKGWLHVITFETMICFLFLVPRDYNQQRMFNLDRYYKGGDETRGDIPSYRRILELHHIPGSIRLKSFLKCEFNDTDPNPRCAIIHCVSMNTSLIQVFRINLRSLRSRCNPDTWISRLSITKINCRDILGTVYGCLNNNLWCVDRESACSKAIHSSSHEDNVGRIPESNAGIEIPER
jgi:hypothetical protein